MLRVVDKVKESTVLQAVNLEKLYKRARNHKDEILKNWIVRLTHLAMQYPHYAAECMRRADYIEENLLSKPS